MKGRKRQWTENALGVALGVLIVAWNNWVGLALLAAIVIGAVVRFGFAGACQWAFGKPGGKLDLWGIVAGVVMAAILDAVGLLP